MVRRYSSDVQFRWAGQKGLETQSGHSSLTTSFSPLPHEANSKGKSPLASSSDPESPHLVPFSTAGWVPSNIPGATEKTCANSDWSWKLGTRDGQLYWETKTKWERRPRRAGATEGVESYICQPQSVGRLLGAQLMVGVTVTSLLADAGFLGWSLLDCAQSRKDLETAFLPSRSEM